jgi:hypothetical protein
MKRIAFLLIFIFGYHSIYSQGGWGVVQYKYRELINFNSDNDQITVMERDNQGNLWFNLMTDQGGTGMGKFDTNKKEWTVFNVGTDLIIKELGLNVNAFAFDLSGDVWVGTDIGLAQFDGISPTGWNVFNGKNSPIMNARVTAITVDNLNNKWVGMSNGMLFRFDGKIWSEIDKYFGTGNVINDLETGLDGSIWIARNGDPGLVKFNGEIFIEIPELMDIRNIMIDEKDQVYVISKDKLDIIFNDKIVETVVLDPRLDTELYEIAFHPEGPFISSGKGILQKVGFEFQLISNENSSLPTLNLLENHKNIPLLFDGADGLWFPFVYLGKDASYASIGHMMRMVIAPVPVIIPVNKPDYRLCYGEILTLEVPNDAAYYVWEGMKTLTRTIDVFDTRTIQLSLIYNEVCVNEIDSVCVESSQPTTGTVTVDVIAQHVYEYEEIGVVTCDPVINRNLVVWKKTSDKGTEYYNIYKMITLDDSLWLGSVNYNALTVFTDPVSDPKTESVRYVITTVDTCGAESYLSSVHKTMHLDANPGTGNEVDLLWGHYEGIPVDWYYIYRGTDSTAMELIDSVDFNSGITQYTDVNSPAYKVYYQVGFKLPEPIILSTGKKAGSGPYSQSMSNLEDNRFLTSVNEVRFREVFAHPNPLNTWTQINFENPMKYPYQLMITDMSGKTVKVMRDIRDNKVIVLRDNLPTGFYLFELKGEKVYRGKFVIE